MSRIKRDYGQKRFRKEYGDVDFEEIEVYPTLNRPFWKGKPLDWWLKRLEAFDNIRRLVLLPTISQLEIDKLISNEEANNLKTMVQSLDNENVLLAVAVIEQKLKI